MINEALFEIHQYKYYKNWYHIAVTDLDARQWQYPFSPDESSTALFHFTGIVIIYAYMRKRGIKTGRRSDTERVRQAKCQRRERKRGRETERERDAPRVHTK